MSTARSPRRPRSPQLTLSLLAALVAIGCSDPPPPATPVVVMPPSAANPDFTARMNEAQARDFLARGKLAEASRAALEAGRLFQQLHGPRHPDTGRVAELFASIKLRLYEYDAAESALLVALAAREAEAGPSTLRVAEILDVLATTASWHAPEREIDYLGRAVTIRKATLGPGHADVARNLVALGTAMLEQCRAAEAEAALREALAIRERIAGPSSATLAEPLEKLAQARWQVSDDNGSEQLLVRAAALNDPLDATEAEPLVKGLDKLAEKERTRKDFAASTVHAEKAIASAARYFEPTSDALIAAADELATAYRAQGNEAAVGTLFRRLSLVERVLPPGSLNPSALPDATPNHAAPRCGGSHGVSNAQAVVAGLASGFRTCYNAALRQNPTMKARFRMNARIGPAGEVVRVRTVAPSIYPDLVIACPMERLFAARFSPPEGGGATLIVPVTFIAQ